MAMPFKNVMHLWQGVAKGRQGPGPFIKTSEFSINTQSKSASVVLDGVRGPPRLARHTWRCPYNFIVLEAMHEASRGPLKGIVSAQKALQGSKTETREFLGLTEEKSVSPTRGDWLPCRQINDFFTYLGPLIFDGLRPPNFNNWFAKWACPAWIEPPPLIVWFM